MLTLAGLKSQLMFKVPSAKIMSVQLTNYTRKRKRNLQSNLHYILILTLLIVLINKIAKFQNSPRNINEVNINYDNLQTNAVYIQLRSKKENRTNKKQISRIE